MYRENSGEVETEAEVEAEAEAEAESEAPPESGDTQTESEAPSKALQTRGEASVPKVEPRPEARPMIQPNSINTWKYPENVRNPNSLLGALIKEYWPGFYTVVTNGEEKLAWVWEDYEYLCFQVKPLWCDGKDAAFEVMVGRWRGEDPVFDAKSKQNKKNRGHGGTRIGGSATIIALRTT